MERFAVSVKMPEKAPAISKITEKDLNQVILLTISDDFKKIVRKVNKEYLYWDKFKYVPLPAGIEPEAAWCALKIARVGMAKTIPLRWSSDKLFSYWLPDVTQAALHFIDQNAGGQILVDEPHIHKKEREHYIINSIMEEAIASSLIEGAATTRKKARDMFKTGRKPKDRAEQMVYNNYLTIIKIKDLLGQTLTPGLLRELQGAITRDTLDEPDYEGRFRTEKDGPIEVVDMTGQVLHSPPPASELPGLLESLCEFANKESEDDFLHPVIKGIILHFWLAYIHPFMDGNGRTSRAIFYWFLLKKKYWLFEYLSISRIILRAPAQYYRAFLYSEVDDGDMTYFVRFHLRAINLAIKELTLSLERKQKEAIDVARRLVRYPNLNYRQRALLAHALSHPTAVYTPRSHMQAHRVVYQTARNDLLELSIRGFLEKIKIGRGFSFVPAKDLEEKLNL